jgi:hypothetical protein
VHGVVEGGDAVVVGRTKREMQANLDEAWSRCAEEAMRQPR